MKLILSINDNKLEIVVISPRGDYVKLVPWENALDEIAAAVDYVFHSFLPATSRSKIKNAIRKQAGKGRPISMYLSRSLIEKLKEQAAKSGKSVSKFVEELLNELK